MPDIMTTVGWAAVIFGSFYGVVQQSGTSKSLPQVVAACTCVLVIKTLLLALLTVRARLVGGDAAFANKKESANLLFLIFKPILLAYEWAPALAGMDAVDRITRCVNNNKEFEPFLVGLLLAASSVAKVGEVSKKGGVLVEDETELVKTLALVATYGRVLHSLLFLTWPLTGSEPRTMAFDGFFFATLGLAVYILTLVM